MGTNVQQVQYRNGLVEKTERTLLNCSSLTTKKYIVCIHVKAIHLILRAVMGNIKVTENGREKWQTSDNQQVLVTSHTTKGEQDPHTIYVFPFFVLLSTLTNKPTTREELFNHGSRPGDLQRRPGKLGTPDIYYKCEICGILCKLVLKADWEEVKPHTNNKVSWLQYFFFRIYSVLLYFITSDVVLILIFFLNIEKIQW